ncbi:hypothetical protein DITRI_Ditri10aG0051300 [Diplodiscus trichospermus]
MPDLGIYEEVTKKIYRYCDNTRTSSIAKAHYIHFNTPWSIIAFLGAFIIISRIFTSSIFCNNSCIDIL